MIRGRDDSSYSSEDVKDDGSEVSISNKRVRKNAYSKWLDKSKKERMREKVDMKQT